MRGGGAGEQPGPRGTRRSRRLQGRPTPEEEQARWRQGLAEAGGPEAWRDWGGLPEDVLVKVAQIFVAQTEAEWAAQLEADGFREWKKIMDWRKREGPSLFVFAMVCKGWRKAQLKFNSLQAARHGQWPRRWPVAPSGPLRTRVESYVILPGRVALAKWALGEGCPREGVNIFRDTDAPGDTSHHVTMAQAAARFGHLELVRWLVKEQGFEIDEAVVDNAAGSGNVELVQWLWNDKGFEMDERLMRRAAESGNLELVKWLRGKGCDWNEAVVNNAAGRGNLELVQWLIQEQGFEMDARLMQSAAESGNLELVKWLRGKGCEWNALPCALAARLGHLEVLQWLYTNGCPMTFVTANFAIARRQLEVLRWARENGCEWHPADRDAAAKLGYTDDFGNLFDPNEFPN